ncbi:hypothetical protein [Primorskyibacter sp. S187A]|uniref:hypothetical protein n=1 Tax=Primorskyibacter sp. S187A TaxID=3415130 RepID=UPI003C799F3B
MALLQLAIEGETPRLFGSPRALRPVLLQALTQHPGPVTFLIHGYKYTPGHNRRCPHKTIFAAPRANPNSWPGRLRTGGVKLAIGWHARGRLQTVYARAAEIGRSVAQLSDLVAMLSPSRSQHILGHSMGARVALSAAAQAQNTRLRSLILLAAAEYRSSLDQTMIETASPHLKVLHATSRENLLFDLLFQSMIAKPCPGDRAIGLAPLPHANALSLQIDHPATRAALATLGHEIAPAEGRINHAAPYRRAGVFGLYSALIRGDLGFEHLSRRLQSEPATSQAQHGALPQLA